MPTQKATVENYVSIAGIVKAVYFNYTQNGIPHARILLEMPELLSSGRQMVRRMTIEAWRDVAETASGLSEGANIRAYGYLDTRRYQAPVTVEGKTTQIWKSDTSLTADLIEVLDG